MRAERVTVKDSEDGYVALLLLAVILAVALVGGAYMWSKNKKFAGQKNIKVQPFERPRFKEEYLEAKMKLNPNNAAEQDQLKRLLLNRAMNSVPIVMSLQSDGTSIERLYKKGMLTDDMYDRVNQVKEFWEEEYADVINEADEFQEGLGKEIWPTAVKFHHMRVAQMEEKNAAEAKQREDAAQFKTSPVGSPAPGATMSPGGGMVRGASGGSLQQQGTPAAEPRPASTSPAPALSPADAAALEAKKAQRAEQLQKELLAEEERARASAASTPQGSKGGKGGKVPGSSGKKN